MQNYNIFEEFENRSKRVCLLCIVTLKRNELNYGVMSKHRISDFFLKKRRLGTGKFSYLDLRVVSDRSGTVCCFVHLYTCSSYSGR